MACGCIPRPEENESMIKSISFAPIQDDCKCCGAPLDYFKSKCGFCSSPLNFETVKINPYLSSEDFKVELLMDYVPEINIINV